MFQLKCYSDKKSQSSLFFCSDFEKLFAEHLTGQMFGFCGPPLLTFKTDRLDIRGLGLGVSDVIYSLVKRFSAKMQFIIYAKHEFKV